MKVALQIIALLILCHAVSSSIVVNYKVLDQVASEAPSVVSDRIVSTFASGSKVLTTSVGSWTISAVSSGYLNSTSSQGNTLSDISTYTKSYELLNGLRLYWIPPQPSDETIQMALRGGTGGWIGVGFPKAGSAEMIGSDAVIGWVKSSGEASLNTYALEGKSTNEVVANPDFIISASSIEETAGTTTIFFTRRFDTGRNPIAPNLGVVIGAYSANDFLIKHDAHAVSGVSIDFLTGATSEVAVASNPTKVAHGFSMYLAFGIMFPFGMMFARFGRNVGAKGTWFEVHRGVQISAFIVALVGFILAFIMVSGAHFGPPFHGQLGVVIMIAVLFQGLYGLLRPHKNEDAKRQTLPRRIFERAHPISGLVLYFIFLLQIFAGVVAIRGGLLWLVLAAILPVITIIAFIALEIKGCKSGHSKEP